MTKTSAVLVSTFFYSIAMVVMMAFPNTLFAATITVDTTADNATASDGSCTLREAITNANNDNDTTGGDCTAGSGTDTIAFNIAGVGPHTITLSSALPDVADPAIIDGSTQSGASCATSTLMVSINGNSLTDEDVFRVWAGSAGTTIKGLNIFGSGTNKAGIGIGDSVSDVTIQCNNIGTNSDGTTVASVVNTIGIASQGTNVVIGGDTPEERNIVAGNALLGVTISNGTNTIIQGNYIGIGADGETAIPNDGNGIQCYDFDQVLTTGCTIGGSNQGEGNVISGNAGVAVLIVGLYDDVSILGNMIGTNASGDTAVPNDLGIGIITNDAGGASNITIGGAGTYERNIISGNNGTALYIIEGSDIAVYNNYIGIGADGETAIPNENIVEFSEALVAFLGSEDIRFGGVLSNQGNVIAGNGDGFLYAIALTGEEGGNTTVSIQGNKVGVDANGTALSNSSSSNAVCISVSYDTSEVLIGGTVSGAGNIITGCNNAGVLLADSTAVVGAIENVSILGNSIYGNGGRGIDIRSDDDGDEEYEYSGPNANDPLDTDTGPNDFLNYPVIEEVAYTEGATAVDYTIDVPAGNYRIEFFENTEESISGYGEGETYVGSQAITHGGSGSETFSTTLSVEEGTYLTATATEIDNSNDGFGATSEFSRYVQVTESQSQSSRSRSSGGIRLGCKDPNATNYNWFSAHRQELCGYASVVPVGIKYSFTKNLRPGMTDIEVLELQKKLNSLGFLLGTVGPGSPGNETSYYGLKTTMAVRELQKGNGLPPVGVVGPLTRSVLNR